MRVTKWQANMKCLRTLFEHLYISSPEHKFSTKTAIKGRRPKEKRKEKQTKTNKTKQNKVHQDTAKDL